MSDAHSFCSETNKGISVESWNWLSKRLAAHHSEWTDRLGPEKLRQERQGVPRSEKTQLDNIVPGSAPAGQ